MPFQRYELFKNNNLRLFQPKAKGSGWADDDKQEKSTCKFFPRTFYRYNGKVYKADNSVLEYNKSIVFKRLINVNNDKDTVLFYDKKTFDTSVERFKSYSRTGTANTHEKRERTVESNDRFRTSERRVSDEDIANMFSLV